METNLREAKASIEVMGQLSERTLTKEMKDGKGVIKGNLVIRTTPENFITFNVYVDEFKKDGKGGFTKDKNSIFDGMETILNEYQSIAEVGEENATWIHVNAKDGKISPYTNFKNGKKFEGIRYRSNFLSRPKAGEELKPTATFEIEMFITSIMPEYYTQGENAGQETGRVLVKGWMPTYSGIEPIELVAPKMIEIDGYESEIADAVRDEYEVGQTVVFYGDVVNNRITITETVPVKIGRPKVNTRTKYINEFIITSAGEPKTGDAYNAEAIKQAITEREAKLEEEKKKSKMAKGSSSPNMGMGSATPKAAQRSGRQVPLF